MNLGNRLTGITYPDTTSVSFVYDTRGRRTSVTDQNGKVTSYAYDDADRLTSVTDAAQNVTHYAYDTENNLLSITDANSHTTSFTYDAFGRVTQTAFPSGLNENYVYDAGNNLTSKTDRKGQQIQYVYDALNRLTHKGYPDATGVDYVFDLAGKIKQVSDPTGTYGFAYDNMGRLIGTTTQYAFLPGITYSNAYGYDAASNRTSFTAPDGSTNTYSYDTLNRLTSLTDSGAGQFTMGYDALSRRTQLARPNGITTSYAYDPVSHLQSILHKLGVNTLDGATYAYDLAGNRTSKTNQLNSTVSNYGYDNIYQLTGVTQGATNTEAYTFDPVGNRLSSLAAPSYTINNSNEVTAAGSSSYTYDNNGNTLTKTDGTGTTTFTWDFENHLTSVHPPSQTTVTFKYDPFGKRIQKGGSVYLYDGANLIEEADAAGGLVTRYVFGTGIDEPLGAYRGTTWEFYQADGLGSITSLSSISGTISNNYTYDSFGNVTSSTGAFTQPFRYTGREWDAETSLYYYRARYYDSNVGRFLSEDPIGFKAGVNFYAYVFNRSTRSSDPFGRDGGDAPGSPVQNRPTLAPPILDEIIRKPATNLDSICGPTVGGACTLIQAALVLCSCDCDAGGFRAKPQLRIYGTLYYFSGTFPYKGRHPKDTSVINAQTAINHEYGAHIDPAISAVTPLINNLQWRTFNSNKECSAECDKTSTIVNKLFKGTLKSTQESENNR